MAGYYDKNKDYSLAIKQAQDSGASQATISQLQQERQNKIDAQYGGVDPYKGTSNIMGGSSSSSSGKGSSSSGSSGGSYTELVKGPGYVTGGYTQNGVYGVPVLNDNPYWNGITDVDYSRRPDLAGKYAISNGQTVFYDELGYAHTSRQGVTDYSPHQDWYVQNGSYQGGNLWTDEEILTANDLARIEAIRSQLNAGKITGDQANQMANEIRSNYGYTIDKQGNVTDLVSLSRVDALRQQLGLPVGEMSPEQLNTLQIMFPELGTSNPGTLLGAIGSLGGGIYSGGTYGGGYLPDYTGQFQYSSFPDYESLYGDQIQSLLSQIQNSSFESWANGSDYQYLKDKYTAAGQNAMQDVLGQVAARTGGYASSYATSAAGQAYNDYMTTLEDAARAMYTDEYNKQVQNLGLLSDQEAQNYNQYLNELSQWNTDRNFAYGAYRDQVADQQWNQQWQYGISRDQVEDQRYSDETAYSKALQQAETLAAFGDFSGYKNLGYTDEQVQLMQAAYQSQMASGNRQSSVPRSTSKDNSSGTQDYEGLFQAAQESGYPKSFISNNYKKYGFTSSSGLYDEFAGWADKADGGDRTSLNFNQDEGIFTWNGKTYSSSQSLLNDMESASLTAQEKSALRKKFNLFGFDIDL